MPHPNVGPLGVRVGFECSMQLGVLPHFPSRRLKYLDTWRGWGVVEDAAGPSGRTGEFLGFNGSHRFGDSSNNPHYMSRLASTVSLLSALTKFVI
jgi:hypothetical protein